MTTSPFAGLSAAVTGGSSGIGWETASLLTTLGARVALLDRAPAPAGWASLAATCDVTDDASVVSALDRVGSEFEGLDILVNCAGIAAVGTVEDNDSDEWHRVLDVNLVGVARVVRAALPLLRRSDSAAIVNVGSFVATTATTNRALYAATKGGVYALTLAMAADHVAEGIRVNCVHPGTTETPWIAGLLARADDPASMRRSLEGRQPTGRMVAPAEVARAICYLASPESASTTGTALAVDGGIVGIRFS